MPNTQTVIGNDTMLDEIGEDIIEPAPLMPQGPNNIQQLNTKMFKRAEIENDPTLQYLGYDEPETNFVKPETDDSLESSSAPAKVDETLDPYDVGGAEFKKADEALSAGTPESSAKGMLKTAAKNSPVGLALQYNPVSLAIKKLYQIDKAQDEAIKTQSMIDSPVQQVMDPATGLPIPTGPKATYEDKVKLAQVVGPDAAKGMNGEIQPEPGIVPVTSPLEFLLPGGVVASKLAGKAGLAIFGAGAVPEFLTNIIAEEIAEENPVTGFAVSVATGFGVGAAAGKMLKGSKLLTKATVYDVGEAFNREVEQTAFVLRNPYEEAFKRQYGLVEPVPRANRTPIASSVVEGPLNGVAPEAPSSPALARVTPEIVPTKQTKAPVKPTTPEPVEPKPVKVTPEPAPVKAGEEAFQTPEVPHIVANQARVHAERAVTAVATPVPIVKPVDLAPVAALPIDSSVKAREAMVAARATWFGETMVTSHPQKTHFDFVARHLEAHNTKVDGPTKEGLAGQKQRGIYGEERQRKYGVNAIKNHTAQAKNMVRALVAHQTGLADEPLESAVREELIRRRTTGQLGYNYVTDLKQAIDLGVPKGVEPGSPEYAKLVAAIDDKLYHDYMVGIKDEARLIQEKGVASPTPKKEYIRGYEDVKYFEAPAGGIEVTTLPKRVPGTVYPEIQGGGHSYGMPGSQVNMRMTSWDALDNVVIHDGPTFTMGWELGTVKPPAGVVPKPSPTGGIFDFEKITSPKRAVKAVWNQWYKVLTAPKTQIPKTNFYHNAEADQYKYDSFYMKDGKQVPIRRIKEAEVAEAAKMLGWKDSMLQPRNSVNLRDVGPDGRPKIYYMDQKDILYFADLKRQMDISSPSYWKTLEGKEAQLAKLKLSGAPTSQTDQLAAELAKSNFFDMRAATYEYNKQVGKFIRENLFTQFSATQSNIKGRFAGKIADKEGTIQHKVSDTFYYDMLDRLVIFRNQMANEVRNHAGSPTENHAKRLYLYAQDAFGNTNNIETLNALSRAKTRHNYRKAFSSGSDSGSWWFNADSHELNIQKLADARQISYVDAERIYVEEATNSPEDIDGMVLKAKQALWDSSATDDEIAIAEDAAFQSSKHDEAIQGGMQSWEDEAGEGVIDVATAARAAGDELPNHEDLAMQSAAAKIETAFDTDLYSPLYTPSHTHGAPHINLLAINSLDDLQHVVNTALVKSSEFPNGMVHMLPKIDAEAELGVKAAEGVSQKYVNQMGAIVKDMQQQTNKLAEELMTRPDDFLLGGLAFEKAALLEAMSLRMLTHKAPTPAQVAQLDRFNFSAYKMSDAAGVKQITESALDRFGLVHDEATDTITSSFNQTRELADMYLSLPDSRAKGQFLSLVSEVEDTLGVKELRTDLNMKRTRLVRKIQTLCK